MDGAWETKNGGKEAQELMQGPDKSSPVHVSNAIQQATRWLGLFSCKLIV